MADGTVGFGGSVVCVAVVSVMLHCHDNCNTDYASRLLQAKS